MWTEARRFGLAACLAAGPAAAQGPLSAIDWLEDEMRRGATSAPLSVDEPPVTESATPEVIEVSPISGPATGAVGLLPTSVTGLPADLWAASQTEDVARRMRNADPSLLPSVRDLFFTLLLAELEPPAGEAGSSDFLSVRIDRLWAYGALEQAQALIERAGVGDREVFARYLDITLMTGTEDRACALLRERPALSPGFPERVFCLARSGDWAAAALTLETAEALGYVGVAEDVLLWRFLDPEIAEEELLPVPLPDPPSPLLFRLSEAVGEPLTTDRLPLAFAQADLRSNLGWRAQIEAAERLVRAGAISPNLLLGLYTERQPAASGGVWDRVSAVQALETALSTDAPADPALEAAWRALEPAGLLPALAEMYAPRLEGRALEGRGATLRLRLGLLTDGYEAAARAHSAADAQEAFLMALAEGRPGRAEAPDAAARAIADGFAASGPPPRLQGLMRQGRLGEAILSAIGLIEAGAAGDPDALSDAIAFFRAVGLENLARRAALEAMILDGRG
jgi:hypothetical protein